MHFISGAPFGRSAVEKELAETKRRLADLTKDYKAYQANVKPFSGDIPWCTICDKPLKEEPLHCSVCKSAIPCEQWCDPDDRYACEGSGHARTTSIDECVVCESCHIACFVCSAPRCSDCIFECEGCGNRICESCRGVPCKGCQRSQCEECALVHVEECPASSASPGKKRRTDVVDQ